MKIQEFLDKTYKESYPGYQDCRPRIVCNDGFTMSVQAGYGNYSTPRSVGLIPYSTAEIGFPSEDEELLFGLAEDEDDYTGTVYPYVDIEVIDKVIEKHNGINIDKTFKKDSA